MKWVRSTVILSSEFDPRYFLPTELENLLGDPTKAKQKMRSEPEITDQEMFAELLAQHVAQAKPPAVNKKLGYNLNDSIE